jgi:RNA-directed DNA polymerase
MTHSDLSMNPDGGDVSARVTIQPALDQNLMAQILDSDNMKRAWKRVKSNQGAPGMDGMTLEDFPAFAREHWASIRQSLLEGSYQPALVRRVMIPKRDGSGERMLGVPCVLDRVIQQEILQVLTPIFDPEFSESSYGSRLFSDKQFDHYDNQKVLVYEHAIADSGF